MRRAILFCVALFCALPKSGSAQTKIRILSSDITDIVKSATGSRVYYLRGNVGLQQDAAKMYCDSAVLTQPENTFDAFGNVRIVQSDTTTIVGETLNYNGDERLFTINENVELRTPNSTLKTTALRFDRNNQTAYYLTRSTLYRKDLELTSDKGIYNTQLERIRLRGNVVAVDPEYQLETDTLLYYPNTNNYRFLGPSTLLRDSSTIYCNLGSYGADNAQLNLGRGASILSPASFIAADSISYNLKEEAGELFAEALVADSAKGFVLEAPYILYAKSPNYVDAHSPVYYRQSLDSDTMYAKGDTLSIREDSAGFRTVHMFEHTAFYSEKFQGRSARFTYFESKEELALYPNPLLWGDKSQFKCDSALLMLAEEQLDSLYLHQKVRIVSQSKDSSYFDAASGKFLYGSFKDNSLEQILLEGNAQSIVHNFSSAATPDGVNTTACSSITTFFEAGEVRSVKASTAVEAQYLPWDNGGKSAASLEGCTPQFNERTEKEEVRPIPALKLR